MEHRRCEYANIRYRMERQLDDGDWLKAARLALLKRGVEAVRVEKLARDLHVTKGSFYWHFKNRQELLEALLREWEEERSLLSGLLGQKNMRAALEGLFLELGRRVRRSERGESPSDAAIFAWAAVSPEVAARVNKEEKERIRLLKRVFRQNDAADYAYMAYLGFLLRRRRVPEAARNFPALARISTALLLDYPRFLRRRKKSPGADR
jgi:AcrR family transcriptional regulator